MTSKELLAENKKLRAALRDMLSWATSGARYQSMNPYLMPVIKRNMKFLASLEGYNDYLNLPLDTSYYMEHGNE